MATTRLASARVPISARNLSIVQVDPGTVRCRPSRGLNQRLTFTRKGEGCNEFSYARDQCQLLSWRAGRLQRFPTPLDQEFHYDVRSFDGPSNMGAMQRPDALHHLDLYRGNHSDNASNSGSEQ